MSLTLYEKIWNEHIVHQQDDGTTLLYVDRHLIHEVTSPQAFEGLRLSKRKVRKPNLTLAVADHNVPTTNRSKGIDDKESKIQIEALEKNCNEYANKNDINISMFQSNIEGELVEKIQSSRNDQDGLIINAGGYTHTSVAIHDALKILKIPEACEC